MTSVAIATMPRTVVALCRATKLNGTDFPDRRKDRRHRAIDPNVNCLAFIFRSSSAHVSRRRFGGSVMALRFQKRLSVLPGVRLNFGLSGISATLGVPGANVTVGGAPGLSANFGVPGTGFSMRVPLNSGRGSSGAGVAPSRPSGFQPASPPSALLPTSELRGVQSDTLGNLTTPGLIEFGNLLVSARQQREDAERAVSDATQALKDCERASKEARQRHDEAEQRLAALEVSWLRRFRKRAIAVNKKKIEQAARTVAETAGRLEQAQVQKDQAEARRDELWVDTEFGLTSSAQAAWAKVADAFAVLLRSERAWDITAARTKRAGAERSVATQVVERKPIQLANSELPILQSKYSALRWQNANGNDLFLYPGFLIVFQSEREFALLDLGEVELHFDPVRFDERETPPTDAKQVGTAWTYANRDGSPDRRYVNNPQWPVLLYGEIHFKSKTGLSEAYMFSNAQAAAAFADAVTEFRNALALSDSAATSKQEREDPQGARPCGTARVNGSGEQQQEPLGIFTRSRNLINGRTG